MRRLRRAERHKQILDAATRAGRPDPERAADRVAATCTPSWPLPPTPPRLPPRDGDRRNVTGSCFAMTNDDGELGARARREDRGVRRRPAAAQAPARQSAHPLQGGSGRRRPRGAPRRLRYLPGQALQPPPDGRPGAQGGRFLEHLRRPDAAGAAGAVLDSGDAVGAQQPAARLAGQADRRPRHPHPLDGRPHPGRTGRRQHRPGGVLLRRRRAAPGTADGRGAAGRPRGACGRPGRGPAGRRHRAPARPGRRVE